jgi:hypothetical protein
MAADEPEKLNSIQEATRANRMSHKHLAELAGDRELDAHSLG